MLQLISLVMVIYSYFLIQTTIPKLPPRIPTHYNAAGMADAWGSPDMLWTLLLAQAVTCGVFLLVPYLGQHFPGTVHFGRRRLSDFSPDQRERILPLLNDMAGWLGIVMNLFFVFMLRQVIQQATASIPHLQAPVPLALAVGGTIVITVYYFGKINKVAKEAGETPPGR